MCRLDLGQELSVGCLFPNRSTADMLHLLWAIASRSGLSLFHGRGGWLLRCRIVGRGKRFMTDWSIEASPGMGALLAHTAPSEIAGTAMGASLLWHCTRVVPCDKAISFDASIGVLLIWVRASNNNSVFNAFADAGAVGPRSCTEPC